MAVKVTKKPNYDINRSWHKFQQPTTFYDMSGYPDEIELARREAEKATKQ